MAKLSRLAGSTGHVLTVFILDASKTDGSGLAGLTPTSSGLACYYKRNRGTASVAVTLANITTLGTYVSGGFKEIDGANMPGFYEFHPPDAALAAGAGSVAFVLRGAAGMAPCPVEIELTATDNQDAVRGGMTALPAAGTLAVKPAVTLAAADVSGNVAADLQTIKGQAVTAGAGVTFPAAIGTSTYAGADTAGTGTLLGRLTGTRAANLDNLDAPVSGVPAAFLAALVESGETVLQWMRKLRAFAVGRAAVSGAATTFLRKDGTTASITVTNDAAGNRTAVTDGSN